MAETVLRAASVTAGYVPGMPILKGVDLRVAERSVTVIIGPNGAGKSTLIKAIAGLVPVSEGTIIHRGQDITGIRPDRLAGQGIAYVPQMDNIFRALTIRQNLDLALARAGGAVAMETLFDLFPVLRQKQADKAGALSGGQRQFLAVAMALAGDPRLILMDEPSAGLAPKAAQEVLETARGLTERGVTILLVEQNVKQALRMADHCYILAEGRNQLDGPAAELLSDPVVGEIYMGARRVGAA